MIKGIKVLNLGVDGRIFPVGTKPAEGGFYPDDWFSVQFKQMNKVGRPEINAFQAGMLEKERAVGTAGSLLALDMRRMNVGRSSNGRINKLLTVQDILDE